MRYTRWEVTLATAIAGVLLPWMGSASAQMRPIPDDTLGEESSTLRPISPDYPGDVIEGGSRQGNALFHSFEEFHVEAGRAIYFDDPGVNSILSRVTGETESQILGLLGVFGDADLFLINPNGIIFGENARLDLKGGSLLATTADSVEFDGNVEFDSSGESLPTAPLLTVQPSAFLFSRANPAAIVNNSRTLPPTGLDQPPGGGLRVADGERITLLGGDVSMDNGGLSALGGRVDVGGLSEPGAVRFNADSSLAFPTNVTRSDVSIANGSRVVASDSTISGGSVTITADSLDITDNSGVSAGTVGGTSFPESQAGDITLDASSIRVVGSIVDNLIRGDHGNGGDVLVTADELLVSQGSVIQSVLLGEGSSGKVKINARDRTIIDDSLIFSNLGGADRTTLATGRAGDIEITTPLLLLTNDTQLQSGTFGRGDAGNVIIDASEGVELENSGITSDVFTNLAGTVATGDGGNIRIVTPSLSLSDNSRLSSRTEGLGNGGGIQVTAGSLSLAGRSQLLTDSSGQGNAGNVSIVTQGRTVFDQSGIVSNLSQIPEDQLSENAALLEDTADTRSAGDIQITAGSLDLLNDSDLESNTFSQGDAGDMTIRTRDGISITNRSDLVSGTRGQGNGGNIQIAAGSLSLAGRSQLRTNSSGRGDAGNVSIVTQGRTVFNRSRIFSNLSQIPEDQLAENAALLESTVDTRSAGDIQVTAGSLDLLDDSDFESNTFSDGDAGNVTIRTRNGISIEDGSALSSRTEGRGNGGNIQVAARSLSLAEDSQLLTNSSGQGSGGNISIATQGRTVFDQSGIVSNLSQIPEDQLFQSAVLLEDTDNTRSAGNIQITAGSLDLLNDSDFESNTFGQGDAGNMTIRTRDGISIENRSDLVSGTRGQGNGGNIQIAAGSLSLAGRSQLRTNSSAQGDAGNVRIVTQGRTVFDQSRIFSNLSQIPEDQLSENATLLEDTADTRSAGNIQVTAGSLDLLNDSDFESNTFSDGDAGNMTIRTRNGISIENGSALSSRTDGQGNGGNIQVAARSLSLAEDSQLLTDSSGRGSAGNVSIATQGRAVFDQSRVASNLRQITKSPALANNTTDTRAAGNIQVTAGSLDLLSGAQIQSITSGQGDAGNITIRADERISIEGVDPDDSIIYSSIFASTDATAEGRGGKVRISADSVRLAENGFIFTSTFNRFPGGTVSIDANTFEVVSGAQVVTRTSGGGRAGDINLDIADRTILSGTSAVEFDSDRPIFSGLFASTTQDSAGSGGTVQLSSPELQVLDQARIEVDSQGSGTAGDMVIAADTVQLNDGRLSAETAEVNGGNIALDDIDLLLLRNGSLISTTAGTAEAGGNGGNIDIDAAIIVALSSENNDIRANAFSGSGGTIRIDTSGLFGIAAQSQDDPLTNDITANSAQGIQGTVDIATPATEARSGITRLPVTFADASNQITQTCAGNSDGQSSEFIVTGRGGLPPSPINALAADAPLVNWAVLDESTDTDSESTTSGTLLDPALSTEERVVEAQGWVRENGRVKLVAAAPTSVAQMAMACR